MFSRLLEGLIRDRSDEMLEALNSLAGVLDHDLVMKRTMEVVSDGLGFDVAWIAESRDGDSAYIRHQYRNSTGSLRELRIPPGAGLTGKVFARRQVEVVDKYFVSQTITHDFDHTVAAEDIKRMMAAPIISASGRVSVLTGGRRDGGSFAGSASQALAEATKRAASAIDAADRVRQITETAIHDERREIASVLHDSIGAMLFAIQVNVQDLARNLEEGSEGAARADSIERHAVQAAAALRDSLATLNAPPNHLAVGVAIRADCRSFEDRSGIPTSFIMLSSDFPALDEARTAAIIASVREGLFNIEKHADATSVVVTMKHTGNVVRITLMDDGVGFEPTADAERVSLGLTSIHDRMQRLGGGMALAPSDDRGTILRLWLPV